MTAELFTTEPTKARLLKNNIRKMKSTKTTLAQPVKLSPPQSQFLRRLKAVGKAYAVETWAPARKLRELGLADQVNGRWQITEAGIDWLESNA